MKSSSDKSGFTIVELLIVIVIIGILATIVIVAYNGITQKARIATLQSDVSNAVSSLEVYNATTGSYPAGNGSSVNDNKGFTKSGSNTIAYSTNASFDAYCVSATSSDGTTYVADSTHQSPVPGTCSGVVGTPPLADGAIIQTITNTNCPTTTKIRAVDARDNHTYWVKKIGSVCWMLTNLGYAGGGSNSYGDVIATSALTNGTGGSISYNTSRYYVIPSSTYYTTNPTNPSTSTDGTGQYGYLYNWCAAMGNQTSTNACSGDGYYGVDNWNHNVSICPAGWRLPTGNGGDFTSLNDSVNAGSTTSDAGLLSGWFGQRGGYWLYGFGDQGAWGYYWSSTPDGGYVYDLMNSASGVDAFSVQDGSTGVAVRCVAAG